MSPKRRRRRRYRKPIMQFEHGYPVVQVKQRRRCIGLRWWIYAGFGIAAALVYLLATACGVRPAQSPPTSGQFLATVAARVNA